MADDTDHYDATARQRFDAIDTRLDRIERCLERLEALVQMLAYRGLARQANKKERAAGVSLGALDADVNLTPRTSRDATYQKTRRLARPRE